jgi:uncharacterized protein (TIGR04255 family)
MSTSLPSFELPPLDEVVMGIQFEPLKNFSTGHMGLFWQRIRDRYPRIQDNPPLLHQVELPEPIPEKKELIRVNPGVRCWFLSEDQSELIQMQRDYFIKNWRQVTGAQTYPRYSSLLASLKREWAGFLAFVMEENLGELKVDQCDLTYVNQIPRGEGWESFSELGRVFSVLNPVTPGGLLSDPEVIGWSGAFKLPEGRGRLYVEITPTLRGRDLRFTLQFSLKVHGAPSGGSDKAVFEWFDLAHKWIVSGFAELTGPDMHVRWKRRPQ